MVHQYSQLLLSISQYFGGTLLDAGCGDAPFKSLLSAHCKSYNGVDRLPKRGMVVGDLILLPYADRTFDAVVCFQVLDDFAEPDELFLELYRVMNINGHLTITVNQQWRLHNEPNDFYRYTRFGLKYRLEKAGFKVILIGPIGGFWAYLANRIGIMIWESLRRPWQRSIARSLTCVIHYTLGLCLEKWHYLPGDTQNVFAVAQRQI